MKKITNYFREKYFEKWIGGYARHVLSQRRAERPAGLRHLVFAFCDHWEPLWNQVPIEHADRRVKEWVDKYPILASEFRDADGRKPCHSFFFPGEQYKPDWLDRLADFTKAGIGEVELHLHHDGDTHETLKRELVHHLSTLAKHGHFSRGPDGRIRYAFIHGNWALSNAREDNKFCGVDDEIPLLFETGCYADYTFPAAPDEAQPNIVNQIYWPVGELGKKRAYEVGERARVGEVKNDRILIIEGPLAFALRREKMPFWVDNAAVTSRSPGTPMRVSTWVNQNIHVEGRPEWVFVKVHTHGAPDAEAASLLGDGGRMMHRELTTRYNDGKSWKLHYVSAREMFNIAIAALEGKSGDPNDYRNYRLTPPPAAA